MLKDEVKVLTVDPKTNKPIGALYEGDKVVRKQTTDYLQDTVVMLPDEPFVKVHTRILTDLAKTLSGTEMTVLIYLLQFISYESGVLKHSNGKLLTKSFIMSDMDIPKSTTNKVLKSLADKLIIRATSNGKDIEYIANPYLFMRGKRINKTLYDLFKDSTWARTLMKDNTKANKSRH